MKGMYKQIINQSKSENGFSILLEKLARAVD